MVDNKLIKYVIAVTIIFTVLDYFLHLYELLIPGLDNLPEFYFIFKVISLPIILYILITQFKLKKHMLCWAVAIILQTRYYFTAGYDLQTNIIMIVVHYVLILIAILILENNKVRKIVKL